MLFERHVEGAAVIAVDSPLEAERVTDGVERWLRRSDPRKIVRTGNHIDFEGIPTYMAAVARRREDPKAKLWISSTLRGLGPSTIDFQATEGKVLMRFSLSYPTWQAWLGVPLVLAFTMGARPSLIVVVLIWIVMMLVARMPSVSRRSFEEKLRDAARRGVTEGIVEELEELRARSRALGV